MTNPAEPRANAASLRVLVVDDDEADRLAMRRLLRQCGVAVTVEEAASAAEALERMGRAVYGCVLLDYFLPRGVDGLRFLHGMRDASGDIPVVIFTGRGDEEAAAELMKAGAVDYLPKASLTPERLASSLRYVMELSRVSTARRRAEDGLRGQEARFRTLANAIPQLAWMAEASGWIYWYNQRWYDFTGTALEQARGWGWREVLHPDHAQRVVDRSRRSLDTGEPWEDTLPLRGKDGTYRWFLARALPIQDEGRRIVGWLGTYTDITERKRAERELLAIQAVHDASLTHLALDDLLDELLARIMTIMATDTAAILLLDRDGTTLIGRAGKGFGEGGYSGVRIPVGKGFEGGIAAEGRPMIVEDVQESDLFHGTIFREIGLGSALGVPLFADGQVAGVVHVGTRCRRPFAESDISLLQVVADRVGLAMARARLHDAELAARAAAEAATAAKDRFLAILSHELRTPLMAMLGWTRMLRTQKLDPPDATRALEVLERNTLLQVRLIEDLLDVSRVVAGTMRIEARPVMVAPAVVATLAAMQPAADGRGVLLESDLDEKAGPIHGDPARLQQIVWNLVSNAIKFTPSGGRVEVRLARQGPAVAISVRDTGKGIAAEQVSQVFSPFGVPHSSSQVLGGMGLGLTIVRHLVELHGGTVHVESAGPGQGSTFTVTFPLTEEPPDDDAGVHELAARGLGAGPLPALNGVRVLVVDDEADGRELVSAILGRCGAEVTVTASARAALEALDRARFDVLVSDIVMPEEDGYDLIRKVRAREPGRSGQIPALAVTAYARIEDRAAALSAGYQQHAAKPIEPAELVAAVATLRSRERQ
jgi:PAS domain S-box-containing protein